MHNLWQNCCNLKKIYISHCLLSLLCFESEHTMLKLQDYKIRTKLVAFSSSGRLVSQCICRIYECLLCKRLQCALCVCGYEETRRHESQEGRRRCIFIKTSRENGVTAQTQCLRSSCRESWEPKEENHLIDAPVTERKEAKWCHVFTCVWGGVQSPSSNYLSCFIVNEMKIRKICPTEQEEADSVLNIEKSSLPAVGWTITAPNKPFKYLHPGWYQHNILISCK